MAYKKQVELIQPGSLNLAMPTDRVGADSIAMHNFRTDRSGALRSRRSATVIATGLGGYVHSIFRMGAERFYGVGASLYVGTTSLASPFTYDIANLKPFGFAAFQKYLWVMTPDKNGRYIAALGWFSWQVAPVVTAPTAVVVAASGGLVEGQEYTYWVTYTTVDGEETNPTAERTYTPAASPDLAVTITPTANTDTRVTHWSIYRIGNTLPAAYRIAHIALPTASFVDTGLGDQSDLEVTRLGIEMETDHDVPPAAAGLEGPYYQRLLAYCTAAHPNRVFYTKANKPYHFPADYWFDVGDESDEIVRIVQHPSHLRIYKKRSVWRLRGDCDTGILERTNAELGLIGASAIASAGGLDYFQAQEGIALSNGDGIRMISDKIEMLWRDGSTFSTGSYPVSALHGTETTRQTNVLAIKNGRLYFSYTDEASARQTLECDIQTLNWCTQTTPGTAAGYTALYYEGQYGELLGGIDSNTIRAIEAATAATMAETLPLTWTSGYRDQGTRDRAKLYADLVIEHSTVRSAAPDEFCTVKLKLDSGDVTPDLAVGSIPVSTTATGTARTISTFPVGTSGLGVEARNAALHIESAGTGREVVIYSAALHYYLEPRDSVTFDTGIIDLNDPRVKGLELLWLDIASTIALTYTIYTDLPGDAMTSRVSVDFTPGTRRPFPIEISQFEGRLLRVIVQRKTTLSAGTFRLYSARLRFKPIGVYLSGVRGNVWQTSETALGI